MENARLVTRLTQILALAGLAYGSSQVLAQDAASTQAAAPSGMPHEVTITDAAGVTHTVSTKMTHAQRQAAAAAKKAALAKARAQAGVSALRGGAQPTAAPVGAPVYDPLKGPDYFGQYSNYANSPLPTVDPVTGAVTGGGMRKFVDGLPGLTAAGVNNLGQYLPVAIPDTTSWPGSDYYEIELGEYTEQMHSDLPATKLRGYRQTNTTDATVSQFHFLGPIIVAQRDRPVRLKFTNSLPAGAGGDLFIPVDKTVMGAGPGPNVADASRLATKGDVLCAATPADCYTENRATIHLHGGTTPWISDGTTHQWIVPAAEATAYPRGLSQRNVPDMWYDPVTHAPVPAGTAGATNDPGPGSMTFYYTNEQSGRLMFYHDHASGITRLNVYVGEAAGYLLTDPVEQTLLAAAGVGEGIPLVIQDRTFVPPPAQLAATDPSWDTTKWGGLGNLWFPHVYVTNQNPWDITGANPIGRWDYGPWFWPPFTGLQYGVVPNPYYNPACNTALGWCEPPSIPGTTDPSNTPESFMDTPIVNGTAYPTLTVDPKAYRFRILNAANDRMWNLSLWVAADKKTTTMSATSPLAGTTLSTPALCDGTTVIPATDCTEVKMVPFDSTYGATHPFPATWGTLDARNGGVPDPLTAGPPFIQIGSEGGILPAPVVIQPQPVNYTYNRRNIVVLNVQEKALFMGPAERADVIVDFSAYAGKTLILYNDAPAPVPAIDPRNDYYTGSPDFSVATGDGSGGAPRIQPGYGPNIRTVMQIVVNNTAPAAPFNLAALQAAQPAAFAASQEPIIVPQAAYNAVYGTTTADIAGANLARIQDTSLTFTPIGQTTPLVLNFTPKAIQELFTTDFGKMNAILGVELPNTNIVNQTTIIQSYNDPATEVVAITDPAHVAIGQAADGTQIWKITHNGVDTHALHFHMFSLQVINRVGWDGAIRPPDPNELGWKETVRMNPLEDIFVAVRPKPLTIPFKVPNSFRPLAPMLPIGSLLSFTNVNPAGAPITVVNQVSNFGWEYVWHCHLLGHEENDMMRAMVLAQPPEVPTPVSAVNAAPTGITLSWVDNSLTASGFRIHRATDAAFTLNAVQVDIGLASTYTDTDPALVPGTVYYYGVDALNTVGSTVTGYPTITASSAPALFPAITYQPGSLMAQISPLSLTFAPQQSGTVSAAQTVTLTNIGAVDLIISSIALTGTNPADFAQTNNCVSPLAAAASCTMNVTFSPLGNGARAAGLTITTSDPGYPVQTVPLSGTGSAPLAAVAPTSLTFANQIVGTVSAAQTVTLSNTGTLALTINSIAVTGANATDFGLTNPCGASLAAAGSCTLSVTFAPTAVGARAAAVTISSNDPANPTLTVALSGTGYVIPVAGVAPASLAFGNQLVGMASAARTVTLSNTGGGALSITGIILTGANTGSFAQSNACGASLAAAGSCAISLTFTPLAIGAQTATLTITSNDPVNPVLTVALSGTGIQAMAAVAPASLAFGNQGLTTTSAAQIVTLTNTGATGLNITGIAIGGTNATDFGQTSTCGAALAAGGSCAISVTFTPAALGARSATLSIGSSDPVNPTISVPLSGTGAAGAASLAPTSVMFAVQLVNTTSPAQTVMLFNTGNAALTINSISITGVNAANFAATSACGASLAPLAGCAINVTFTPSASGTNSASLSVSSNDPVNPTVTAALSGAGSAVTLAPASIVFPGQLVNTTSASRTATLSNAGTAAMTISGVTIGGANASDFLLFNGCGTTLGAGRSCTISVRFRPSAIGTRTATLSVADSDPTSPQTVALSGVGGSPILSLAPTSLAFSSSINVRTAAQTITVSNTGTAAMTINSISRTGTNLGQFGMTQTCGAFPASLAAGASCTVNVTFMPTTSGAKSASITVSVAAPATSQSVALTGTVLVPALGLAPTSLAFGSVTRNTTSAAQTVTVSNSGTGPMTISGISLAGNNPGQFAQTNNCVSPLAAGGSCTVNVTFAPTSAGAKSASLRVTVGAPATSGSVALSGTGL